MAHVLSAVAWPYANGPRHIGHVAGFGVPSDVFSRYMRMAGHDVLMVSGTDEHGTPILVAGRQGGREPARARRPLQPGHRRGPHATSASPTTSSPARRRATTTPSRRSCSDRCTGATATWSSRRRAARSARRPAAPCRTATSRAPARSAATARPAATSATTAATSSTPTDLIEPHSRINGEVPDVRRDAALLPRPPGPRRGDRRVARRTRGVGHLAALGPQLLQEPARGGPPAGDDPRPRLGDPGPDRGLARPADEAVLRVVRRGGRLPLRVHRVGPSHRRPGALARVVERPRGAFVLLPGQGQHHLPLAHLARRAPRVCGSRRQGRYARGVRRAEPADRGRGVAVPHHGRRAVLQLPGPRRLRARRAARLRAGPAPVLHLRGRPGEPGRRVHLVGVRPAQQLRARRRVGQPRQPDRDDDPQAVRRDPGGRAVGGRRRGPARRGARRVRDRRRTARAAARPRGDGRGDAAGRRGQRLRQQDRAVPAQGRRRARAPRHDPPRPRPGRHRPQHPDVAVPPAQRERDPPGPRRRGRPRRPCRGSRWSTTSTADPHTRSSPATTRRRHGGSRGRSSSGRRSRSRRRCSASSTRRARRGESAPLRTEPAGTSGRPHPTPCRSRSSTTTSTSTSPGRARTRRRRAEAVAAASAVGVDRLVQVGCDPAGVRFTGEVVQAYAALLGGVAVHPNEVPRLAAAGALDDALAEVEALATHPRIRVVGETGLDYYRTGPDGIPLQQNAFPWHIDLAKRTGTSPADPRPRRSRRRPADPRRGGCPAAYRPALLLR